MFRGTAKLLRCNVISLRKVVIYIALETVSKNHNNNELPDERGAKTNKIRKITYLNTLIFRTETNEQSKFS